jgi:hypothetical protein
LVRPQKQQTVMIWRKYFYTVITHFGGEKTVYITDKQVDKYYHIKNIAPEKTLALLVDTLISQYGLSKNSVFDFSNGKYPQ